MNIFVTNDDGINEKGMRELVKALHERAGANIFVCAPDGQRSAMSHSISMRDTIYVEETEVEGAEMAFVTSGTPVDCVVVGLHLFRERGIHIDLLFAGINHGSNIGTDTVYSGTVGAATEGAIHHIPSAAVSVDTHHASHFEYACDLAVDTIKKTGGTWDSRFVININTPNLPKEEIKGVKYTVIGEREYVEDIKHKGDDDGKGMFRYGGHPVVYEGLPDTIDVIAMQNGYASITPLKFDMTANEALEMLEDWRIGK